MQRFRALLATKRSLQSLRCLHRQRRSLSSVLPNAVEDEEPKNHVLVEGRGCSRLAILDRPSSLNALTTSMAARLTKLYQSWEENPDIGYVVMKGSGRAFSAGGDIVTLYRQLNEGKVEHCKDFFRTLYKFIYLLGTYLKPHVAFLNGITMGGGAGVSIPGTFRVATDKTIVDVDLPPGTFTDRDLEKIESLAISTDEFSSVSSIFSTPEIQIGFHPDAGASFYLSHLPGYLGEYLALTGASLNGAEMIACGLATHYSLNEKLNTIEDRLANLMTDDPSIIETQLNQYGTLVYPEKKSVVFRIEEIDKCFGHDTVEEIIDALEQEVAETNNDWCTSALKKLKEASPLSLKVSLRSVREGRYQSLDQCLIREYRMSLHGISKRVSDDFCEGVRARLVDKDYAPKWDPPSLEQVSTDMVDYYFSPLGEVEPELELPTGQREAF